MKKVWDETTDMGRLLLAATAKHRHIKRFADIADHLGNDEQVLSNWKKRGIPAGKIFELADEFSCNPKWLATGKGSMHEGDQNPFGFDWSKWSVYKVEHTKEIEVMPEEEFSSQKPIFQAVIESSKNKSDKEE